MSLEAPEPADSRARSRWSVALVILLALSVHLPSLGWGFVADDYGAQLVMEGRIESPTWKPWSLYDFGTYELATPEARASGAFPWWTDGDWRVRFLRPLTSLSLWLDHQLFGRDAFAGHAVNLVLFALLLLAALRLHERLGLPRRAALLALLILAFDNGALMPVGWLSNRNSLLEGLFTVLALLAGLRAVERASPGRVLLALGLAGAAVGAKESGLHAFALLAILFWGDAPHRSKSPLLPRAALASGLLAAVYLAAYVAGGYGSNALFYPTPWGAPAIFASRTLALFACAPIAAASPFPVDALAMEPAAFWPITLVGLALGAPIVWFVARRLRHTPRAGFFLAWGALALLPQAGAPPSDRLMFTPMLGWAPLLALFLASGLRSRDPAAPSPKVVRPLAWTLAVTSLLLSPLALAGMDLAMVRSSALLRELAAGADVGADSLGVRDVFLMQASPTALIALAPLSTWRFVGGSTEVRIHPLQSGQRALRWTRLSDRSFSLETEDEPFLTHPMESVFLTHPVTGGGAHEWRGADFVVHGTPGTDGRLRRIEIELERSLDDPRCRFLVFDGTRLVHRPPPAIGETARLERAWKDPLLP